MPQIGTKFSPVKPEGDNNGHMPKTHRYQSWIDRESDRPAPGKK